MMTDQSEAIREVLAVVDDRASRGIAVTEFRKIFPGYHSHRHMRIGGRDSPLGFCFRKQEIDDGSGRWVVFARFDTLEVRGWCLKELSPRRTREQKMLF